MNGESGDGRETRRGRGRPWRPRIRWTAVVASTVALAVGPTGAGAQQGGAGGAPVPAMTRAEVMARLAGASDAHPANFVGQDLSGLDLSGVDLSRANLARARLVHTRLLHAKLFSANLDSVVARDADLTGAILDVSAMRNADFTHATLRNASLYAVIMPGATFADADLSGARMIAAASDASFARANLSHADIGADPRNQPMGVMRTDFTNVDFSGADLSGANLRKAKMTRANFTGATLAGADFALCDLSGAIFHDIRGRETIKGLGQAIHADEAIFDRR